MAKYQDGDTASIWFPDLIIDAKEVEEFGRNDWGIPATVRKEFKAAYSNGEWHAGYPEADESFSAKTLSEVAKRIKDFQEADTMIKKVGPVKYEVD